METERTKVLIVSRYHPREIFAVRVGEYLLQNNSNPDIKVVKYTGKPDRRTSTYNLRKFIENFNPVISPIIFMARILLNLMQPLFIVQEQNRSGRKH